MLVVMAAAAHAGQGSGYPLEQLMPGSIDWGAWNQFFGHDVTVGWNHLMNTLGITGK